jgi:FKBP-type peptidyl-prolyl cis-trans isomerase FkpA
MNSDSLSNYKEIRMLIRTSLVAAVLVLSGCGSDPASTQAPVADTLSDGGQNLLDDPLTDEEIETSSGLLYKVMNPAEGPKPSAGSVVTLHYIGTLTDGTLFDSSYSRGEPATFELTNTIEGFKEGVQLMSVGSRYSFTIPAYLAYGQQGVGEIIAPGDTLVFVVELLEINSI